mgnify:CR=1 FL=1
MFAFASENLDLCLQMDTLKHLLRMQCSFFDDPKRSSQRLATRLSTDSANIRCVIYSCLINRNYAFNHLMGLVLLYTDQSCHDFDIEIINFHFLWIWSQAVDVQLGHVCTMFVALIIGMTLAYAFGWKMALLVRQKKLFKDQLILDLTNFPFQHVGWE